MKTMFQTFVGCTPGLVDILKEHHINGEPVDIKEVVSRFTTDVIGSCAFGIDCNSLKNPNSEFRQFGRKIFEPNFQRRMKNWLFFAMPREILIALGVKQTSREIETFFMNVVRDTVRYRENNDMKRKDFIQLLLQLRSRGNVNESENVLDDDMKNSQKGQTLTIDEIAAQCFVFFLAGFETSASTMTFALLELARNPDVQQKLRDEAEKVLYKHDGELSYDAVMEMSYLDKIIHGKMRVMFDLMNFLVFSCE